MPVVDYMTQVELWCIMSFKCALVENQTNMRVTKSIAMCRIEMKRCRFGVQNGVLLPLSRCSWAPCGVDTVTLLGPTSLTGPSVCLRGPQYDVALSRYLFGAPDVYVDGQSVGPSV